MKIILTYIYVWKTLWKDTITDKIFMNIILSYNNNIYLSKIGFSNESFERTVFHLSTAIVGIWISGGRLGICF